MNDRELDARLAGSAPFVDDEIARWDLAAPMHELCEAIMITSPVEPTADARARRAPRASVRRERPRTAALLGVAATIVAAVTVTAVVRDAGSSDVAWAAPLVAYAERTPLLLVDDPAWPVTYADERGDGAGEVGFGTGGAELHWRLGSLREWVADRADGTVAHGEHDVVDATAVLFRYGDAADFTALWPADGLVLELRASVADIDTFRALLDSLVEVDADTWLDAMPPSVIDRAERAAVVDELLVGVPLPAGFDAGRVADGVTVADRYQLAAGLISAVSCGWIERWVSATSGGDAVAAREAVDAMSTWAVWPAASEVRGPFTDVVDEAVTAMVDGSGEIAALDVTLVESYRETFGCGP